MVIKVSGTVSLGPQGGPLQNPSNAPGSVGGPSSIVQSGNDTSVSGEKVLVSATNAIFYGTKNVGSVDNPSGSAQNDIDQGLSTTAERRLASAYFNGGVGIEQDLAVGGFIYGRIAFANSSTTSSNLLVRSTTSGVLALTMVRTEHVDRKSGAPLWANTVSQAMVTKIEQDGGLTYQPYDGLLNVENVNVNSGNPSSSPITGAFTVTGGVGISGDVYIGGQGAQAGGGVIPANQNTGTIGIMGQEWATAYMNDIYSKFLGNTLTDIVLSPKNGINRPTNAQTGGIGDGIKGGGYVDIFGELRVRGNDPVGTAPVVTNVLYVTMDGDDTNDGGAMDASRACRTISGAVKSPLYRTGTQIRVSAGHYLENNPIRLKPYTSVMGSDIRTTGIEPINKTQDLFHVDSGCYIAFCQFLNGRSGLLPGNDYINGTNRGAYCTAFPPLTGNDRIDLFHSPYIQNCTNMSGPWLKDGEMFVPNESIQIPVAVGQGSWPANTTTIVVTINNQPINGFINAGMPNSHDTQYTGELSSTLTFKGTVTNKYYLSTITNPSLYDSYQLKDTGEIWVYTNASSLKLGHSITAGPQNQSFFNARTLLLANKPFMQEQVVSYIDTVFNSGGSKYNKNKCKRDIGLIVNAIAADMLEGGTSDSTFAGIQYWNQGTYTGQIPSEITATIAAIDHLKSIALVTNNQNAVNTLFDRVTGILRTGVTGITDSIVYGGLASTNAGVIADVATLQTNKASLQSTVVAWVSSTYPSLSFNPTTCSRDVGYIIDSVCYDLLHGGNVQTTKSGVYYYSYTNSTTLVGPNEVYATTSAYSYLKSIIGNIVQATPLVDTYQKLYTQNTSLPPATLAEASTLQNNIDVINTIVNAGPSSAGPKTPIGLTQSNSSNVLRAYNLLQANIPFLKAEITAYIDKTLGGGFVDPNTSTCVRDIGLIVDIIGQDMIHGTTSDSTFAGLQYWSQDQGFTGNISTEITATKQAITQLQSLVAGYATHSVARVNTLFGLISNILNNGPTGITNQVVVGGLTTSSVNTLADISTLQYNKASMQSAIVAYVNANNPGWAFPYNKTKCERDTGLIVDAVVQDLLFGGKTQTTFSGIQYWNHGTRTGAINSELTTTTNAINYLSSLAQKVILNNTSGPRYQSAVAQNTSTTAASVTEQTVISGEFTTIVNILNNGVSGVTDTIIPNGITASTNANVKNAYASLQANKAYLTAEVVAYVETTKTAGFTYDQATCARDVGYIVDSVCFDLLYGGNLQAIESGVYYWGYNANSTALPGEQEQSIAAYNYLKSLLPDIVTGTQIASPYQNVVPQYTTGPYANIDEATEAQYLIDNITNIINYGPIVADAKKSIGLTMTNNVNIKNAAAIIHANRDFLKAEIVAYVDAVWGYTYDQSKCYRDVGYMIDAICSDLATGGNLQSIKSGIYYYAYDAGSSVLVGTNEKIATTAAYSFIQSIIPSIVYGETIAAPYQSTVKQNVHANPATTNEVNQLLSNMAVITGIIQDGPSVAPSKTPQALTLNPDPAAVDAWQALQSNRAFIQAEVVAYINYVFSGSFEYNKQKSYRDAGILVEQVAYDVAFGGNEKSIEAGVAFWNGPVSYISAELPQCIAAINYLNNLCQAVVLNKPAPVLPPVDGIPHANQVINTVMIDGDVAQSSINNAFSIIIDIAKNGPSYAPPMYKSTGPDSAYASAEILLQANRAFIQEQTINYINYNLANPRPNLPYNKVKCARDTGLVIDSFATDLLFQSDSYSQTTFAGLQYFAQTGYVGNIPTEIFTTTQAISYLQTIATKVIKNVTAEQDAIVGIQRYSTATQITSIEPGTNDDVGKINEEFGIILSILKGNTLGWTDKVKSPSGQANPRKSVQDSYALLQANKSYMQTEVLAYITSPTGLNFPTTSFNSGTCVRDMGYIIDSVCFDLLYGGNRQAIQSGLAYYSASNSQVVIPNEVLATVDAFTFLGNTINAIITAPGSYTPKQTKVAPVLGLPTISNTFTNSASWPITKAVNTLTSIIANGPSSPFGTYDYSPASLNISSSPDIVNAFNAIEANREFMIAETLAYLDQTYNAGAFTYNQDLCYRDAGLLVDAVSQDILLGGNQKSIEAGLSYWNQGYNYVTTQLTTMTQAINYIASISKQIIANNTVTSITGTVATQVINPFFEYGDAYMPQQAVERNFGIISTIISRGPDAAPPVYAGGGLFALTGVNGLDVQISPTVTYVEELTPDTYVVGLSTATIGFGNNATLYFGDTLIFPLQDKQVEELSLQQTGSTSSWDSRKVDPIGGMGGSLVDGAVISDRSPIQSFVYDAFTQLTQGGRGVHITNNGYAQLVSVFTIFASVGVQVDNGGIASIVNSNANFGDICLLAKGYGTRKFSGTVFNPPNRSYPFSPGPNGLDQYYPAGFWPNLGGSVNIFVPDLANRPHISLVMEVVPPDNYENLLNSPQLAANGVVLTGFLNAQPSTPTLTTGTIALTGIDTTNVYIGNTVTIIDQFGYPFDNFPYIHDEFGNYLDSSGNITTTSSNYVPNANYRKWYCATGTVVTDVNFNSITLNQALTSGGGFSDNNTYFTIYFTGNSYYTVQTSVPGNDPYKPGTNILATNTNANYQGPAVSQIQEHAESLRYLNSLTLSIINNTPITPTPGNTSTQYINQTLGGGGSATPFINLEFKYITSIITATNLNAALSVVPNNLITKTGQIPNGAGSAITLIENNLQFLGNEVYAYVKQQYPGLLNGSTGTIQQAKCLRDVELIMQQVIYDLQTGGNYNAVYSGLSYWSRPGAYHIVTLGEAVTDPSLFPDGAIVNFYQRSYISASGYVFEYVGAGSNYGALPQFGIADPVQGRETVQLNSGKVFFTSTDQNGDFRIGPGLVISQATGVISGRTFTQSLFANMTPFILAIEAG